MYEYRCAILSVVDADTLHVELDLGIDIRTHLTVRLSGLNAPEISTKAGKDATTAVVEWITGATGFTLKTTKDRKEKFGRYLGSLSRDGDPQTLNAWLLANGYAVPYDGGPR